MANKIAEVRAYVCRGGGGDYHDQNKNHWILGQISTPMSRYPEFRATRSSWGIDVLGTVVVEIEANNGAVGFGVSTGGFPAAWIVENHLARFLVGKQPDQTELMWNQMFLSTAYYGRKGLVMNAISAVDLALWDLLGKMRGLPVYEMIGGEVRHEIPLYATGPRPDLARRMGFVGGKLPLVHSPSEGVEGFKANVEAFKAMREIVGDEFMLMYDCWMSLDLPYARRLSRELSAHGLSWIEECFLPDDYRSYAELRRTIPPGVMVATGEHEYTRYGFGLLLEGDAVDVIQPDVTWCGGLTELLKISAMADARQVLTIPHGSSVYGYHFVATRESSPFAEFLMMAPDAASVVPMFYPLLLDEPVPNGGRVRLSREPGFGVKLNRSLRFERPTVSARSKNVELTRRKRTTR